MEKISSGVIHTSIPPPPWLPACNYKYLLLFVFRPNLGSPCTLHIILHHSVRVRNYVFIILLLLAMVEILLLIIIMMALDFCLFPALLFSVGRGLCQREVTKRSLFFTP